MRRLILGVVFVLVSVAQIEAATPWDPVSLVSQSQYETYQVAVQDMGLGLYGGPAYDQGYRNRYNSGGSATASLGFQEATLYLTDQFTAMGLGVSHQSDYMNVVAELPGTKTPDKIFIVGGHYDHPQRDFEAPGGDDNASGTAGVLEAARVLSQYEFESTIRFIGFGGEEGWMKGSWDYVRNVVVANDENVVGMLNMDMILRPGWDSDPNAQKDLDLSTGTSAECQAWAQKYMAAGAIYAPSLVFDSRNPQTEDWYPSDQGPFIEEGYAGLMIAENTAQEIWNEGSNDHYHTAADASDRAANDPQNGTGVVYDYAFATDVVRTTVGMIAEVAAIVSEPDLTTDFNGDGNVTIADLNALAAEADLAVGSAVPPADTKFDLNGDDVVDSADLDVWLADAATINGFGSPYLRGDANLDGDVDVFTIDGLGDAQILSSNLGVTSGAVWGDGDFNGDGDVDVFAIDGTGDAQVLSSNLGRTLDVGVTAVPEPSTFILLTMAIGGLLMHALRRRK